MKYSWVFVSRRTHPVLAKWANNVVYLSTIAASAVESDGMRLPAFDVSK